jgi:RPA family protein
MAGNIFERMKAVRLFAAELRATTIEVQKKGGDQYESQLYFTQTGLKASRVMIVGTATEIEDIGTDGSFYRMRVSDPTGVFFVTAGQYQPEAASFMQEMIGKLPAFVTVIGKASLYTPKEGTVLTSIRAEKAVLADENIRNTWLVETAKATLDRLTALKTNTALGLEVDTAYPNKEDYKQIVKTVLLSMKSDVGVGSPASSSTVPPVSLPAATSSPPPEAKPATKAPSDGPMSLEDMKNFVEQKIIALNKGKGVKLETLGNPCKGAGMTLMQLEAALKGLMDEGRIYEPKVGLVTASGA